MLGKSQNEVKTAYFRRKNKNSYSLNWIKTINIPRISEIICEKEQIAKENLILVNRGKQIKLDTPINSLQHMQIIHVVNLAQTRYPQLSITVKNISKMTQTNYQVSPSAKVKDFICQKLANIKTLPYFYIGLVYLGKILHPQKTFEEEMVENDSELIYVDIRDYIKQKQKEQNIMNITDIISGNIIGENQDEESEPQIVVNRFSKTNQQQLDDSDLLFTKPSKPTEPPTIQVQVRQPQADLLELQKNHKAQNDLNETKYPMSIHQLEIQSRYDGPHNETRLLFDRLDSLEESMEEQQETDMPELPQPRFQIKISQVESDDDSEAENIHNRNRVEFNEQDSRSILSCEVEPTNEVPMKEEEESSKRKEPQRQIQKKEALGSRDIQLGQMILNDQGFKSQTVNFLDKILTQYKFMFQ